VTVIQFIQTQIQKRVIAAALQSTTTLQVPAPLRLLLRIPILRDLPAKILAFGVREVHVRQPERLIPGRTTMTAGSLLLDVLAGIIGALPFHW
jgi:hypothetical protein